MSSTFACLLAHWPTRLDYVPNYLIRLFMYSDPNQSSTRLIFSVDEWSFWTEFFIWTEHGIPATHLCRCMASFKSCSVLRMLPHRTSAQLGSSISAKFMTTAAFTQKHGLLFLVEPIISTIHAGALCNRPTIHPPIHPFVLTFRWTTCRADFRLFSRSHRRWRRRR